MWLDPGLEVVAAIKRGRSRSRRARVVVADGSDKDKAGRARKRLLEKLWDLRNPGKRRSYDRNMRARVHKWEKANPERKKKAQLRYRRTDRARELSRVRSARYRARLKAKQL